MTEKQTDGRDANGAIPPGKPDASTSREDVEKNGRRERRTAGPDGPDAGEIGETFKNSPGGKVNG